jgi:hypothetical protein
VNARRKEQLRQAKRRQREKDRDAGLVLFQFKLPARLLDKVKKGLSNESFTEKFYDLLKHEIIVIEDFPALQLLCWNLRTRLLTRKEAFDLYERNWRHIELSSLTTHENQFIDELKIEHGQGVLNV